MVPFRFTLGCEYSVPPALGAVSLVAELFIPKTLFKSA